ncbi:hypothetical protein [Planctellipticum variicoloris]|uniref:hypothetical protein n=1 Tax=Planctellipticum variicoloris TaxID=3064265 RepID=UPI003013A295|nr:hypothetical protein SH412_001117 [Planctomycetaceae bacterium SH412]
MQRYQPQGLLLTVCLVLAGLGHPTVGVAQEPPATDAASLPESEGAAAPDRTIYIPFKNLRSVFEGQGSSVLMPYREYLELAEKWWGDKLRPAGKPPVEGLVSSATYVAKVERDIATVTATLVVTGLDRGWAEVPLRFGEAAIGELSSDTGKVLLRGTGNGTYALLLPEPGEHRVTLQLTARVRTSPDGRSLELELPPVGITTFELVLPEADQIVELSPKLVSEVVKSGDKETRIKAGLGATEKVTATWHSRAGTRPDMELLTSVTNQTLVSLEDGLIHTDAWLTYEVLRGQLDRVRLAIPKEHRILDITSEARVKDWTTAEEEGRQVVTVEFLSRASGKVTLEVHTERPLPADAVSVVGLEDNAAHGIHALDALRESGQVAVRTGGDLTLTVEEQQGLSRIDESEVDARLKRPGALYFKYYSPAVQLKVLTRPVQPRLIVRHQSQVIYRDEQLRLQSSLNYAIDRAGVFELKFRLPAGMTVENVVCAPMKQFDVSPDQSQLTILLKEKLQGEVAVQVVCVKTLDTQAAAADQMAPLLEPEGTELENGSVQIYAPDSLEVITDIEKVVSAQPDPNPQAGGIPNSRLVSSWVYNRRPVEIPVRMVRKPTRLTATVGTRIDARQGQVQVVAQVKFLVEYAGLDTFRIAVPEPVADTAQITLAGGADLPPVKQKSKAAAAVDGWVTWTIVLQREVVGTVPFEVRYELTPKTAAASPAEQTAVGLVRVESPYDDTEPNAQKKAITVSRIAGEVTVVKDRALAVATSATGGDVEPIDVRELTQLAQDGFVAYRYYKQPVEISLSASKYDIQAVVETVIPRALVEIVIDRNGAATYRARYVIRSSERQRLALALPKGVEPLGVMVDRKTVALEKNPAADTEHLHAYFVNVARATSADEQFSFAVMFRNPQLEKDLFQTWGGNIMLRLPVIGGETGVAIQQLKLAVWMPQEYALVATPDGFTSETRSTFRAALFGFPRRTSSAGELDQWIGSDATGLFDFPVEGRDYVYSNLGGKNLAVVSWWPLPAYTWLISGALVVIAVILRNTSWENKLTILVIGLFLAAAYALKDSEIILHAVTVAAYGIAALIALWLIHGLLGARPTPVLATAGGPSLPVTSAAAPNEPEPEREPPQEPPSPPVS